MDPYAIAGRVVFALTDIRAFLHSLGYKDAEIVMGEVLFTLNGEIVACRTMRHARIALGLPA